MFSSLVLENHGRHIWRPYCPSDQVCSLSVVFALGKYQIEFSSVSDTIFSSRCCHLRYHLPAEVSLLLLNAKLLVSCFASLWLLFDFLNYVLWSAFVTLTSQDIAIHPNTYWSWWHDHYCRWQHPASWLWMWTVGPAWFLCMHELVPCYVLLVLLVQLTWQAAVLELVMSTSSRSNSF